MQSVIMTDMFGNRKLNYQYGELTISTPNHSNNTVVFRNRITGKWGAVNDNPLTVLKKYKPDDKTYYIPSPLNLSKCN